MTIDPLTTVAFTGHRTYDDSASAQLYNAICSLYASGYRTFMSGMAAGFDLAAAEAVLALKGGMADLRLVCVIPFEGQSRRFAESVRARYERVVEAADEVVTLAPHYTVDAYLRRNDFLADHSTAVIAYLSDRRSGTAYTVRRALHRHSRVINLCDNLIF